MTWAPSPGNAVFELTYFVRLGVGSQQGDGINRATAVFPGARGTPIRSNTALFKVNVQGGVFSNEGCIVGKVFMDCDGNMHRDNDGGSRELGIPGVRLVMLDGSFIVTDNEGKYSLCGVKPQTHVIKVDRTTLPAGPAAAVEQPQCGCGRQPLCGHEGWRAGDRADFIEGSCSPEVLEQVKARGRRVASICRRRGLQPPQAGSSGCEECDEQAPKPKARDLVMARRAPAAAAALALLHGIVGAQQAQPAPNTTSADVPEARSLFQTGGQESIGPRPLHLVPGPAVFTGRQDCGQGGRRQPAGRWLTGLMCSVRLLGRDGHGACAAMWTSPLKSTPERGSCCPGAPPPKAG
jgi:hypothetical protein